MDSLLQVWLFGEFRVLVNNKAVLAIDSPRLQLFFAYVILHQEAPISKQQLASLFWPDTLESQARANLRKLIFRLRQVWTGFDQYLVSTENTLHWNSNKPLWCDVLDFQKTAQAAKRMHTDVERYQLLELAAGFYKGEIFPGCYEDWIVPLRNACLEQYYFVIQDLIQIAEAKGDYASGIHYAEQLRTHENLYEPVYLTLMRLHSKSGNRARALEVYQQCRRVFHEELNTDPGPDIQTLYQSILHLDAIADYRKEVQAVLPFVGRDAEWNQLHQDWIQAANHSCMVIIKGETGIGKSRLAEEFAKWVHNQGFETSSTRCYAAEGSIAYAPMVNWLSSPYQKYKGFLSSARLRELARILPGILSEFPKIEPPVSMTESWQRMQFFEAMAQTMLLAGGRGSNLMLLIIDDLHWCDSETLEWLLYLLRLEPSRPLLILGTYRVEEVAQQSVLITFIQRLRSEGKLKEIELTGLDQKTSALLAEQILNHSLDKPASDTLFSTTSGNPLFVVEAAGAWATHQPKLSSRLQGMIEIRLNQLSKRDAVVIDAAAVIGREFAWDLLRIVTGMEEEQLVESLSELFEKRIIRERGSDTYDFMHDQIREVAYSRIPIPRLRTLHRRVAEAIQKICVETESEAEHLPAVEYLLNGNAVQIASHFEKAGSLYQAFQYYARAAENAARIYAHQESETLYANAIRLVLKLNWPGRQLTRLFAARGRALEHLGRFAEAVQVYTDLEALSGERNDAEMQCVALTRLAACYNEPSGVHNPTLAKPLLSKGLAIARAIGAHELEAQIYWSLLVNATHYGTADEGRKAAESCLELARKHDLKDLLAICLHDFAVNLRLSGDIAYGTACAEESRAIFRANGNLSMLVDSLNQQALIDLMQLNFSSAQEYVLEAAQISLSIQNHWNQAYASWIQGMLNEARGKWSEAQVFWEESIAIGQEAGFLMSLTTVELLYGDLLRRTGQLDKALEIHRQALDASLRQASFLTFASHAQMALDYFEGGDQETGEHHLKEAQSSDWVGVIGPCIGLPFVSHALADWASLSGEWQSALESIRPILAETQRRNLPYDHVQVCYDFGCILEGAGRTDEAEEVLLSIQPQVEKSQFLRLHHQITNTLASHYQRFGKSKK
jgi:DNA-binding SARP family transcriptional activator